MKIAIVAEIAQREYVLETLKNHSEFCAEIVCIAEYKPKQAGLFVENIPVVDLFSLKENEFDTVLVAIKPNFKLSRLLCYFHREGISNIYIVTLYAMDKKLDFISQNKFDEELVHHVSPKEKKPYWVHLETHVCDNCNLNCKACNNFAPFFKGRHLASAEKFETDLSNMAIRYSNIGRLFLLGGEPLLEPELCCEFIKISRKYFPKAELRVLTNGTLIQKMKDEFWNVVRANNVIIHISVYPPVHEKLSEIMEAMEHANVKWLIFKDVDFFVKRLTDSPLEDATRNNELCGSGGCHYLRNGRISKCPDAELVKGFDEKFGTAFQSKNYVEIENIDDPWEAVEQLNKEIDLCKYCTHDRLEKIHWEPVGAEITPEDFLVENRLQFERKERKKEQEAAAKVRAELEKKNKELKTTKEKLAAAEKQLHDIQNSFSYKLGRKITWLPRKVGGGGGKMLERKWICVHSKVVLQESG